jgi:signal transduction histidine kinase
VRRRILVTIVIVTTIAVTALYIPAALAIRDGIQRRSLLELQREAAMVANTVTGSGPVDVESLLRLIERDHGLALYDGSGIRVDGDGPARADLPVELALEGSFAQGYVGDELVAAVPLLASPVRVELVVRIGEPRSESRNRIARELIELAAVGVGIVAAAGVIGWLLARRLSRPLEQLQEVAGALGEGRLEGPAPSTGIPEFDELAITLDDARARISELLDRERAFSSHVSHQLRTPAAAMRVAIETELTAPRADPSEVLHESLGALDRLEATITSLLDLARHDAATAAELDLLQSVTAAAERWRPIYARERRTLRVAGTPASAVVVPSAVEHILDVLLDNALRHGQGAVFVDTTRTGGRVWLTVRDEGVLARGADPFSERRTDSGHGIGLRLARTLAESQRGELTLRSRTPTEFALAFPATAPHVVAPAAPGSAAGSAGGDEQHQADHHDGGRQQAPVGAPLVEVPPTDERRHEHARLAQRGDVTDRGTPHGEHHQAVRHDAD